MAPTQNSVLKAAVGVFLFILIYFLLSLLRMQRQLQVNYHQ